MIEASTELNRRLFEAVEKMPAFPKSVQLIIELTNDINCSHKELVMVIEKDPVMTMKLLKMLNSAYYSFPRQITSVNQSVVYLGLNTIKNLALSFAAMGSLPQHSSSGFDFQRYLLHSLTTAGLARTLCQKFSRDDTNPSDCYVAGLLHDFGKVVFAQFMTTEFKEAITYSNAQLVSLHTAEQRIIGADHTVVGSMLVEKWQLSRQLIDSIHNHHSIVSPDNTIQSCLFVADQISKLLVSEGDVNLVVEELPADLANRFEGELQDVIESLGDLSQLENEAQLFAQIGR